MSTSRRPVTAVSDTRSSGISCTITRNTIRRGKSWPERTPMDRQAQISEIIRTISKKNTTPDPDESLFDSGLLDSFALPDVLSALEKAFSIKIPDSDLNPRKFDSISRIESYIESRLSSVALIKAFESYLPAAIVRDEEIGRMVGTTAE